MATSIGALGGIASGVAAYAFQDQEFKWIDTWLSTGDTDIGGAAHIAVGLGGEAMSIIQAPLVGPKLKAFNMANSGMAKWLGVPPETAELANRINAAFIHPNIEGIVIFTEQEVTTRQMDVSTTPLVVQEDLVSTTYVTDNAVPHPRKWQLRGYLTTVMPSDHYFVLKPSLLLQRNYLDMCMRTRKPVWFKTYDNTFVKVLIENMTTQFDPKSMNTLSISLDMIEYKPIMVSEHPLTSSVASKLGITLR